MTSFSRLRKLKGEFGEAPETRDVLVKKYKQEIDEAIENGGYRSVLFHPLLTSDASRLGALEDILANRAQKRDEGQTWLAKYEDIAGWMHAHKSSFGQDPGWDTASWR
jgi:hypothetical protein